MLIIQGFIEGQMIAEEQLSDADEMFAEAMLNNLFANGCDTVEIIEG